MPGLVVMSTRHGGINLKQNKIVITLSEENKLMNCQINTDDALGAEELIFALSSLIEMFSNDSGLHPIQLSTILQNTIVERFLIQNQQDDMQNKTPYTDA